MLGKEPLAIVGHGRVLFLGIWSWIHGMAGNRRARRGKGDATVFALYSYGVARFLHDTTFDAGAWLGFGVLGKEVGGLCMSRYWTLMGLHIE